MMESLHLPKSEKKPTRKEISAKEKLQAQLQQLMFTNSSEALVTTDTMIQNSDQKPIDNNVTNTELTQRLEELYTHQSSVKSVSKSSK